MARKLEAHEQITFNRKPSNRFKEEWFDGDQWVLEDRIDFTCLPASMATNLYAEAKRRGMRVNVRVLDNKNVVCRFYVEESAVSQSRGRVSEVNQNSESCHRLVKQTMVTDTEWSRRHGG